MATGKPRSVLRIAKPGILTTTGTGCGTEQQLTNKVSLEFLTGHRLPGNGVEPDRILFLFCRNFFVEIMLSFCAISPKWGTGASRSTKVAGKASLSQLGDATVVGAKPPGAVFTFGEDFYKS